MTEDCQQLHIAAAGSYDVVTTSVNLTGIILVLVSGTGTVDITNREGTPKHIMSPFTITVKTDGTPQGYMPGKPVPMNGGIKITIAGGSPVIDAWIWFQKNP